LQNGIAFTLKAKLWFLTSNICTYICTYK
jgi:hypothetical protein